MTAVRLAPGPPGWPLIGHLPAFLAHKLGFLTRCAEQYGEIVKLNLGMPTYLLNNPDDIQHVLATNHANYMKTGRLTSRRGRWLSGDGLLTSSGARHREQRLLMQPLFHQHVIAAFGDRIAVGIERMLARWKDGARLDIAAEMMTLAHEIIGRIVFGVSLTEEALDLGQAIGLRRRYLEYWFASLVPRPELVPNRLNRDYRRAMRTFDAAVYRMIRARRDGATTSPDLLGLLMQAEYKDGSVMSDQQVRDEVMMLSITGAETIGEALAWTWYLLARHPEVEARLVAELRHELGDRAPSVGDLPRLPYTEMVLLESLRLYPPTWIYVRMANGADILPSGFAIPRGSKLYLCQYVVHRNPKFFAEPDRFDPSRFADEARRGRPKYAYFPFGGGPRVCIGQSLGMMEGALAIASIARQFRLALLPDQTIVPFPGITLRPAHGIRMQLSRRPA